MTVSRASNRNRKALSTASMASPYSRVSSNWPSSYSALTDSMAMPEASARRTTEVITPAGSVAGPVP